MKNKTEDALKPKKDIKKEKKDKPKDLAKAAAAAEVKDAPAAGDAATTAGKKRRRTHRKNRHIPVDKSQLSLEERERRRQQREARERALAVRAKGQKYRPLRVQRMRDDARERKGIERLPRRAPQVIVLPIFWKERTEEMDRVIRAAREVEIRLRHAGYQVYMDASNLKSPGERMKRWEVKGVKARVEVGPKDSAAGTVTLAVVTTPGAVATRASFKATSEDLLLRLREAVGNPKGRAEAEAYQQAAKTDVVEEGEEEEGGEGAPGPPQEASSSEEDGSDADASSDASSEEEEEEAPPPKAKAAAAKPAPEAKAKRAAPASAPAAAPPAPAVQRQTDPSGDHLGDDFAVEIEAQEDEGKKSKKGKKVSKRSGGGEGAGGAGPADEDRPAWLGGPGEDVDGAAKKKAKVVKF